MDFGSYAFQIRHMGAMYDIGLIWSIWYRKLIQEQEARLAMGVTLGNLDKRHGEWGSVG